MQLYPCSWITGEEQGLNEIEIEKFDKKMVQCAWENGIGRI